jgi:Zn finger protein HypA/HybF involved in hydrogenase expression
MHFKCWHKLLLLQSVSNALQEMPQSTVAAECAQYTLRVMPQSTVAAECAQYTLQVMPQSTVAAECPQYTLQVMPQSSACLCETRVRLILTDLG